MNQQTSRGQKKVHRQLGTSMTLSLPSASSISLTLINWFIFIFIFFSKVWSTSSRHMQSTLEFSVYLYSYHKPFSPLFFSFDYYLGRKVLNWSHLFTSSLAVTLSCNYNIYCTVQSFTQKHSHRGNRIPTSV